MQADFLNSLPENKLQELYELFLRSEGVATDTRKELRNKIFFALKGKRFDANEFLENAIEQNPAALVIERKNFTARIPCFYVENSLKTLQLLAKFHREKLAIPLVAVGGSNGKTTTKELLHTAFSVYRETFKTPGNYNNHIGVPLSLLQIKSSHQIAVLEFGDNRLKDLQCLCNIASPTMALLTNVGKDHIGNFGSMNANYQTKFELTDYVKNNRGPLVLPYEDEIIRKRYSSYENAWFFGKNSRADASVKILDPVRNLLQIRISGKTFSLKPRLLGEHNALNIAATLLMLQKAGFEITEKVLKKVENLPPYSNRGELLTINNSRIFLDAYNANPSSMQAVLTYWASAEKNFGVILGEMAELGKFSPEEHRKLGKLLTELAPKFALLVGKEIYPGYEILRNSSVESYHFNTVNEIPANLLQALTANVALTLVKGSRKNKLEEVLKKLNNPETS